MTPIDFAIICSVVNIMLVGAMQPSPRQTDTMICNENSVATSAPNTTEDPRCALFRQTPSSPEPNNSTSPSQTP